MNALQTFDFETNPVRSFERDGQLWFVAADVCRALGLTDTSKTVAALDGDEKGTSSIRTPSGDQNMLIVNESGLYTIILRSREAMKPGSLPHRFRKWVTGEVLPALRQTGRYAMREETLPTTVVDYERVNCLTRLVSEARQVYGRAAAKHLWERLPLPQVRSAEAGVLYDLPTEDPAGCLAHLMRVALDNGQTVRAAIQAAWKDGAVRSHLAARGLKVVAGGKREHVGIAERHPFLAEAYAATPWADDWYLPLLALDGAKASRHPLDFGGQAGRAVLVPKALVAMG